MKLDFKNVALSTAAGLAVTAIGYLIWRHEQAIQAAQAAQQQAAQQATSDYTVQALQQQVQQLESSMAYTGYGSSYGSVANDYSQVSGTTLASVPSDSNLSAILSAFLGTQQSSSTTGTVSTASSTSPTGASDSNTTTAATPSTTTQVASAGIPASLLAQNTITAVSGINQQQASNPIVSSSVGASTGTASTAVSASHTLATTTGQS